MSEGTAYVLGSDDAEIARLDGQASSIAGATEALLRAAGIGGPARVLDLGTGCAHWRRMSRRTASWKRQSSDWRRSRRASRNGSPLATQWSSRTPSWAHGERDPLAVLEPDVAARIQGDCATPNELAPRNRGEPFS